MPSTQTVEFRAVTGQTVMAKLFSSGSDTEVASVSATEATNRKGTYTAAFTDVPAGEYQLIALNAAQIPLASWWVTLTLTTATFGVYDKADTRDLAASLTTLLNRITTGVASMFSDLITMITGGGTSNARWTTKALENVATGSVYVLPTKGTQQDRRVSKDEIEIYKTEGYTLVRTVTDATGANVDLSGKTLELIIEGENRNDKAVIPDADIDVSGTGNATYTVEIPTTVSAKADKTYNFYLWDKTNALRPKLLDKGRFVVEYAGVAD